MNCLECSLSPATDMPMTAIGACAYCGAGVCLDHARDVALHPQPVGVVPESRSGARRIVCTTCYAAATPDGARAGTFRAPVRDARVAAGR